MSEITRLAIEEAIRAHVADEAEGLRLLTDWYLVTASVTENDDETDYLHVNSNASWHRLWGLTCIAERRMREYVDEDDG